MTVLLGETAKQRRHWITTESPPVKAILEKFPCLADTQVIIKEFCHLSHVDEEGIQTRWTDTATKLLKYAPLEDKKSVKKLLDRYNLMESSNEGYVVSFSKILLDQKTPYVIQILSAILSQDQKNKGSLLTVFEGSLLILVLYTAIKSIQVKVPCIAAFGATLDSVEEMKVVIEECIEPLRFILLCFQYILPTCISCINVIP